MSSSKKRLALCLGILCVLALVGTARAAPSGASTVSASVRFEQHGGQVLFEWTAPASSVSELYDQDGWTTTTGQAGGVPIYPVVLAVPDGTRDDAFQLETQSAVPMQEPVLAWLSSTIQDTPLRFVREGVARGQRFRVVHFSPLFRANGAVYRLLSLRASLSGVLVTHSASEQTGPFVSSDEPANPLAAHNAVKIVVRQDGLQQIALAALQAFGLGSAIDPARIVVMHNGRVVPVQRTEDAVRFYAPSPGDRWNATDIYWLAFGDTPSPAITARHVQPATPDASSVAFERGVWQDEQVYDSWLAGEDGDHWFARELRTTVAPSPTGDTLTAPIDFQLPLSAGTATLTLDGASRSYRQRALELTLDSTWKDVTLANTQTKVTVLFDQPGQEVRVRLRPGEQSDSFLLNRIAWEMPVRLDACKHGIRFWSIPGVASYRLSNSVSDAELFDITDPSQPVRLEGTSDAFYDTEATSVRNYLVTGPGTLYTPELQPYQAVDLERPLDVDVVYIAPTQLKAALEPLAVYRRGQGYRTAVVDVADIYNWWSYGLVSPEAIRRFLRHAAATWERVPIAVVLVGDGTSDPHDYVGRHNANLIPPYLARVDHTLGETACETCYVQLDGSDPLDDPLPDMQIGRLPVKSAGELQQLIAKLIDYEQAPPGSSWRSRVAYIADNADAAGDFAAIADASAAKQPAGLEIARVYYDPQPGSAQPLREPDPVKARERVVAMLEAGAAVVSYHGHGLQWQWAATGPPLYVGQPSDQQYLLGLYDVDTLSNGRKLPVVLGLTCLTGAFQQPAYAGTTIDERLILHSSGGAIAVWSSTGLSVTVGQQALQNGFFEELWRNQESVPKLGQLLSAGYARYFADVSCCEEGLRTYALLGDPLTQLQIELRNRIVHLPLVRR